eukprot:TRINITY_DN26522_c0_g1_i1.p1 TRINITY_DN26522_c0_g1~~TRINITY_DN26522_c0_g1_i1.p1  ORF type:complete len:340 (+),score=75.07 TRINITY_DN26522_c0_g1_i1:368-1387(+)
MAIIGAYTMTILADAEKIALDLRPMALMDEETAHDDSKSTQPARLTYPETVKVLFPNATIFGRNVLADLVTFMIILTSLLVSSVYIIFITGVFNKKTTFDYDSGAILLILAIPVGLLAQLRSFKYLAFTSVLGDIAVTTGIVGTIIVGLTADDVRLLDNTVGHRTFSWPDTDVVKSFNDDFEDICTGLATISFLFLVHIMTLPMAQSLEKDLEQPKEWHKVAWVSYSFIGSINLLFTLIAVCIFWNDYNADKHGNPTGMANRITDNLGDGVAARFISVLLCVDLLFTIPMIMSVGREIIENAILPPGQPVSDSSNPIVCLLYTSPSPRDRTRSRMPSSA